MGDNPVLTYCRENTHIEIRDLFKYLFQSCFGCEHLVSDYPMALGRIEQEMEDADKDDLPEIELLDGDFCRVHLKALRGVTPQTFCRLFMLSCEKQGNGKKRLEKALEELIRLAAQGEIPFAQSAVTEAIDKWRGEGFPAVHHSTSFRDAHHPAYRVIKRDYLRLLPVLAAIDGKLHEKAGQNVIIAIDGRCASGKTTLVSRLEKLYDCNIFHMDDFFLRPEQRTPERLAVPGENVDHERFLEEVLRPLSEGQQVVLRRYDCHGQRLEEPVQVEPKRLSIVEGSYSFHPTLFDRYDLTVFSDIGAEEQRERIVRRDPQMAEKFFSTWIPMEEKYFSALSVREKADLRV